MKAWLIQIDAWNGAVAAPVRMASHDDERLCNLDGQTWWPVIEKLPTLRYDFFDGSFDAASITSPSGSFDVAIEAIPALPALAIHDARIRIWGGKLGDAFAAFTLTFDGRVKEQPAVSDGSMSISIGADDSWLDQPLLKTYAGTGAAEGGTDLEGQVKSLALGAPRFAPATLVDAVDNIYQLSGYGPLQLVETAFERLNRFGAVAGNAGNFAGLKAGEVKRGEWATCLAEGFVKFGAPPEQPLSFHVRGDAQGGWSRLPGDLCRRVAELAGGVAKVAAADVAALNVARPWPLSIMVTAQTTARDLIQRIAMSVNAVAYIDWLGMLRLAAVGIGTASLTMAADGSALPPVAEVRQVETNAPYWKIAQGAAVTWQVHGLNDIAFSAPLNPRGPYDPAETYREGDMVTLANGSQWLFVGSAPATSSEPADDNANWFRLSEAITAANVTYGDGKTVEELKPAEPGATNGATPAEKGQLTQLEADAAAAATNIAAAQAQIAAIEGSVSADFAALNASVSTLNSEVDAVQGNIASLQSSTGALQQSVTGLSGQVVQAQSNIATITGNVSGLSNQVGTLSSNLSSLTAEVGTVSGTVSGLTSQVGTINVDISALTTRISGAEGQISATSTTVATQGGLIQQNAQAISNVAGNLATLTTRVSASNSNLLPNGGLANGFASGVTSWGAFFYDNSQFWGPIAVTSQPGTQVFSFAPVPANPGSTYTVSCDPIAYTAEKTAYVDIIFQDANGQNLYDGPQNPLYGPFDFSASNTRRGAIAVSATAPPGTAKMVARFVGDGSGAGPVGFRRMKLEHGDQWTAFSDEASVVQTFLAISTANENIAQLTTTVGAQGATITQQATAISNLQGTTASLSSTVQTQGGQISNLQTVTTTQGGTIAQHTTDIATANANISTNATAISTANGNIANLTTRVGSAETAITSNATAISNVSGRTATLESTVSTQGASISSLQTATSTISGNLASLTTRVAASSPNLLPNGGLENGFNSGVSDAGGFNFIIGGWGPTATTNANGIHVFQFTPVTEVQINAQYTFAVDPLNIGTSDLFANILCLNSAGQVILDPPGGFTPSAGDFSSNDTRRALMACTITVPAGTVSLLCRVYGTVRDNQYIGFRRAKLERGPTWTAYTTEASVVQTWTAITTATGSLAALTTRVGTAEGSISTAQTAISNLQGTTAGLSSTVQTQGGQISNLQSVTTTQGGTIAQHTTDIATANANISTNATAISTLNGSVATLTNRVAASGSNLLPNGGLANGFASGVGTTGTFGFDNSQFWGPIAVTGQPGTQVFTFAPVPANPGSVYTLHCDPIAYQVGCLAFVDILFRNSAGQVIYDGPQNAQTGPFDFSENNARRALIAVSAQAPASAVDMVARFVGEVANGGPVGFRRMKLEHGANWTSFSDEASVVQTFSALSSLGTSYAALETRVSSAEGSVTTLQSTLTSATGSISTLQTNVASLNGSVSTLQQSSSTHDGQISTLQTTVSAQGTAISSNATAISAVQGSLATLTTRVNANQPNLLNNGGLENGFAGIASSTANWSWNNTAEWGPVAATTTNGTQVIQFADITAVQPGATYWMHCDPIAYGSSTIYCDLLFYDGAGNMLLDGPQNRQDGQFNFSPDDTRRGMIAVSAVAPAGTAIIKPRVVANVVGNQIAGFRRIKVETGPTWSRFSSEASVMQQFQAISTLNTSYSSLSTTVSSQGGQVDNLQTAFTGLNGTVATLQTTVSAQGGNISTLQTAQSTQAGQITTLQTKLVSGGGNLLQNSDFAVDMTFWGFNQQGSAHTGGRDFLGDNYRPANEHVASIYHSNNNPADYAYWSSQLVAVEQNKFYEFSVGAANSRAGVLIYLRFLYGDSSIAADFTAAKSYYSEGNNLVNFPTIYARGKAPPGVYWVQCLMLKFGTDAGQSDSYAWFVRPQLVEVPGLTGGPVAYSPGGTSAVISVQAQAISSATGQLSTLQSTVQAQGAQVNNLQTAYSGLNGTVATLQSTVSANGAAISTLQSTTSTLQGNVATLTTRVSAAGTNLLPNGGLENGFNTGIGDTGGFNFTSGAWGPHALTTANGLRVFQFSPVGSIQIGADYTFAVDPLNFGASDLYCNMILVDSSGGVILDVPARSPQSPGDFSGNDVRRSQVACTATIPAGTASIVCRVYGTVRDGQPLGFRRAKLERGSTWTPYSAEATIVQQYQTLSTLNTQYSSLSSTVQTQGVTVSTHSTAITTLNGNVTTLFGQWGVELDVNGYVSGVKTNNNGTRADMTLRMDKVKMVTPSGLGGYWQVVFDNQGRPTQTIGDDAAGVTIELGYLA